MEGREATMYATTHTQRNWSTYLCGTCQLTECTVGPCCYVCNNHERLCKSLFYDKPYYLFPCILFMFPVLHTWHLEHG